MHFLQPLLLLTTGLFGNSPLVYHLSLSYIAFPANDVARKLNKLRVDSASGPDGLPTCFLKRMSKFISQPLSKLFETFFLNSYVPPIWKEAYVKPIYKGGNSNDVKNYRPISLTCVICKIMESIINEQMMYYLLQNDLIGKNQHGFLKKRSTCSNLLDSFQDWVIALNSRNDVDIAFIDFSKAFDSVTHNKLLHKLLGYGIRYELLNWIKTFLTNRTQRVLIDCKLSGSIPVHSGVVQGSVLGALLFIIFVNDVTTTLEDPTTCQLYADDMKLYSRIELGRPNSLASSLTNLKLWSETWQLNINNNKCSIMHLGTRNPGIQYNFGIFDLPNSYKICDLGITYNAKINFSEHIDSIVNKAYQRCYLIFKSFESRNPSLLKQAFVTYVRPLLEYCTPVWSPYLIKDITKIENVQRYFTRRLFPKNSINYTDRLILLNLESLEQRRLKFDLKMYFQIIHNLINLDKNKFFTFLPKTHGTRGHDFQIQIPLFHNNRLSKTFASRAIDCWNALPTQTVTATSIASFKKRLNATNFSLYLHG